MKKLTKIKNRLVEQKYRFDIGMTMMTIMNFILLVLINTNQIRDWLQAAFSIHITTKTLMIISVPAALLSVWLFGTFLDKVVNYQATLRSIDNKRNPELTAILEKVTLIEKRVYEGDMDGKGRG